MEEHKEKDRFRIWDISVWRICAYFIIYSFIGFVIETLFALINYGVLESRQSFLYGPFCCIYGVGAVIIILILKSKIFKNNYTLFVGGFVVGSIVEYLVSFIGEIFLHVKWWDYSDRFMNINGRICLLYSIFWGLLGVYLMKSLNPKIDKFINLIKSRINIVTIKIITALLMIFLFVDCILSAYAINIFLIKVAVEHNLAVPNQSQVEDAYNIIYYSKEKIRIINKYFGTERMLLTYPNLTIMLEDGSFKRIKNLYPEVKIYYHKFNVRRNL